MESPSNLFFETIALQSIPRGAKSTMEIETDDAEVVPRLVKAFNHAIELWHSSKPEPF